VIYDPFCEFPILFEKVYSSTGHISHKTDIMKKTMLSIWAMLLTGMPTFAQIGGIEDSVNDISDTIRTIFPLLLGVIFLVGFLFNAGHFFGENADLKKGITRVLVFVLIAGAVVGIFTYLIGIVV